MSGRESESEFFDEPDTAETVERGWRLRWQRPARDAADGGGREPVRLAGLVGLRRLAIVVAVVIASVVALVTGLGGCKGSDNYSSYLERVRAIAQSSTQAGHQLARDLRSSSLNRSKLARRMQNLATQEQQAYDRAVQIRPPGPLRQIHLELLAALELRATGLASLAHTLATFGSHNFAASTADVLAAQARLLTTSDVVWSELYRIPAAAQLHRRGLTGLPVPHSRITPTPDLVAGPAFARLLQRLQAPPATTSGGLAVSLKPGDSGTAVASWQKQLNRWLRTQPGQSLLPIDGTYGNLTTSATKALQQAAAITADGIVGPATRHALTRELAAINQSSTRG